MAVQTRSHRAKARRAHLRGAVEHVELDPISASEWRVSDPSIPEGDAGSVLGFVEMTRERGYEVVRLRSGHGVDVFTVGSLEEVVDHFARSA